MELQAQRLAKLLSTLAPVAVALDVWAPVVSHYSVRSTRVTGAMVASARHTPSDATLDALRTMTLFPMNDGHEGSVAVAEGILRGRLALPGHPVGTIGLPFSAGDLDHLPPRTRLRFAGYAAPAALLAAFTETGREEFLDLARDMVLAWNRHERPARLPRGYLWNDHATAARACVLSQFWRLYRHRPDYDPDVGRAVLQQAARYGELLADPRHFTFASNHGLMQNLGLLLLGLGFPTLPQGDRYQRLAVERLAQQLSFLVDDDGVIRENSAGYQAFGLEILGMILRCMTLQGAPIPAPWRQKYERGLPFLRRLQRPDGTLPAVGDTDGSDLGWLPRVVELDHSDLREVEPGRAGVMPDHELSLHAAAGYWIEWDGLQNWPDHAALSQTVATWNRPPPPSHKHADELSVLIWSHGFSWLTSVGYWPDVAVGREQATSWSAANAPHRTNEPPGSDREARLVAHGATPQLSAVDLERRGPGSYVARRQVVHVKPDLWIIVDHVHADTTDSNETVWTVAPEVDARRVGDRASYVLTAPTGEAAELVFLGSTGTTVRDHRGSASPFAGWHVVESVPLPAPAMKVTQPAGNAHLVVVLSTGGRSSAVAIAGDPQLAEGSTADGWTIRVPLASGPLSLSRADGEITVQEGALGMAGTVRMTAAPDPTPGVATMRRAFDDVAAEYPQFQSRMAARIKVTKFLATLVIGQEISLHLVRRGRSTHYVPIRVLSALCWAAVGVWLHSFALRSRTVLRARDS